MDVVAGVARASAVVAMLASGACYDPSLRDCAVACTHPTDCAGDQVCGTDGLCASADRAGHCSEVPDAAAVDPADARVDAKPGGHPDARPVPDAMPPDAALVGTIHVQITGRGRVTLDAMNVCESPNHNGIACDLTAPAGPATLQQMSTHGGDKFDGWSGACTGGGGDCHVTVLLGATVSVGAAFQEDK